MTDDEEAAWAKIRITQTVDELLKFGPSVEIGIAPAPFEGKGLITVLAQIDTGAAGSGMSPRLTRKLNLKPVGKGEIREVGREPIVAHYFSVRLFLPSNDIETDIVGLPSLEPPHDVLIGRDILAKYRLIIDFPRGLTGLWIKAP